MVAILLVTGVAGGCRHATEVRTATAAPTVMYRDFDFPTVQPVAYNPDDHELPDADSGTKPRPASAAQPTFRGVLEVEAQCLAAKHTSTANLLDQENAAPVPVPRHRPRKQAGCDAEANLRSQVREATALELRNRSAADALERYFQLADAESRSQVLRDALPVLDQLRDLAAKAKAAGVRYPLEPEEADRQRSLILAQIEEADSTIRILNLDLRRRIGLPWAANERLWPKGDFALIAQPLDEDAAAQAAMANRPELKGLRAVESGLSAESLPAVREMLRAVNPLLGSTSAGPMSSLQMIMGMICPETGETDLELVQRRRQVAELRADRERAVSDEARAAAMKLNAQVSRVALARGRVDSLKARVEEARKQRAANLVGSDLMESQATLEWMKARTEVIAEVMAWHQARIRMKAAQGLLALECR